MSLKVPLHISQHEVFLKVGSPNMSNRKICGLNSLMSNPLPPTESTVVRYISVVRGPQNGLLENQIKLVEKWASRGNMTLSWMQAEL